MPQSSKIVVVFHADGCVHCREYIPRFRKVAQGYRGRVPIKSVKMTDKNFTLLERYGIEGFPTTAILNSDETLVKKVEGAINDAAIARLFERACS